ncbi:hypothetical protein EF808_06460 [archaeon]|nr:MAG: hypothetical protein EF808_06460 [archaeon]
MESEMSRFNRMVEDFIKTTYEDFNPHPLVICDTSDLERYADIFSLLWKRYNERWRYDLHGTLKEAEIMFDQLFKEVETKKFQPIVDHLFCVTDKSDENSCDFLAKVVSDLESIVDHERKKVELRKKRVSIISSILSFADIIISVALIVAISFVSHIGQDFIGTVWVGVAFIVLVAFFKVSLDRFYILPLIRKRGWKLYRNVVRSYESIIAKIEGISLVVCQSMQRGDDEMYTLHLISKGLERLDEE